DTASARRELRDAMADAPASGAAMEAARTLLALPRLAADDHLSAANVYDRNGNAARAADEYRAWLSSGGRAAPPPPGRGRRMGRALFAAGRYRETIEVLGGVGAAPPAVAAEASYVAARARYRTAGRTAAIQSFLATAQRFPGQPSSADALWQAADLTDDA